MEKTKQMHGRYSSNHILHIGTDASLHNGKAHWAMIIVDNNGKVVATDFGRMHTKHIVEAEMKAIDKALAYVKGHKSTAAIVSDSQVALNIIYKEHRIPKMLAPMIRTIRHNLEQTSSELVWVRGHGNNLYNDAADRIARASRRAYTGNIPQHALDTILGNIIDEFQHALDENLSINPVEAVVTDGVSRKEVVSDGITG